MGDPKDIFGNCACMACYSSKVSIVSLINKCLAETNKKLANKIKKLTKRRRLVAEGRLEERLSNAERLVKVDKYTNEILINA